MVTGCDQRSACDRLQQRRRRRPCLHLRHARIRRCRCRWRLVDLQAAPGGDRRASRRWRDEARAVLDVRRHRADAASSPTKESTSSDRSATRAGGSWHRSGSRAGPSSRCTSPVIPSPTTSTGSSAVETRQHDAGGDHHRGREVDLGSEAPRTPRTSAAAPTSPGTLTPGCDSSMMMPATPTIRRSTVKLVSPDMSCTLCPGAHISLTVGPQGRRMSRQKVAVVVAVQPSVPPRHLDRGHGTGLRALSGREAQHQPRHSRRGPESGARW